MRKMIILIFLLTIAFGLLKIENVNAQNLISYWKFDDPNDIGKDVVGNNDGTLIGNVGWTNDGIHGGALTLDGDGDWVEIPDSNTIDISAPITLEAWINLKLFNFDDSQEIISKRVNDYVVTYDFVVYWFNRTLVFYTGSLVLSDSSLEPNQWYHVVVTNNGTYTTFYINGKPSGGGTQTLGPLNSAPLRIGASWTYPHYFNGKIDEVAIYSRVLTANEVQEHYYNFIDSDSDGVINYEDACPTTFGVYCNGCPEPTCHGCAVSYCPTIGEPYCIADDFQCSPTICPSDGCGVGGCLNDEIGVFTPTQNSCELADDTGTCTNNPCILTCSFDKVCAMQDEISTLKEQLRQTQEEVSILKTTISTIQGQILALESIINNLKYYVNLIICQLLPKGLMKEVSCPVYS
jgi:hypothetical protein